MNLSKGYNRTVHLLQKKKGENGQRHPSWRPSVVVYVATDWFTEVGLKCPSECTVGFCNEFKTVERRDNIIIYDNYLLHDRSNSLMEQIILN